MAIEVDLSSDTVNKRKPIATSVPRSLQRPVITLGWLSGVGSRMPSNNLQTRRLRDCYTNNNRIALNDTRCTQWRRVRRSVVSG